MTAAPGQIEFNCCGGQSKLISRLIPRHLESSRRHYPLHQPKSPVMDPRLRSNGGYQSRPGAAPVPPLGPPPTMYQTHDQSLNPSNTSQNQSPANHLLPGGRKRVSSTPPRAVAVPNPGSSGEADCVMSGVLRHTASCARPTTTVLWRGTRCCLVLGLASSRLGLAQPCACQARRPTNQTFTRSELLTKQCTMT